MSTTILAEQTRLDLGQLVLISPTGTEQVLGSRTFDDCGTTLHAEEQCVFIEAFGLKENLPAALLGTELVEDVSVTTAGMWSAPLHQMRVRIEGVEADEEQKE